MNALFWIGLVASFGVGGGLGLWFLPLTDWLRCRSVGIPDPREAAVCPVIWQRRPWRAIPWEWLARGQRDRWHAWLGVCAGGGAWAAVWVIAWLRSSPPGALLWGFAFASGLLFVALLDLRWRMLPVEPLAVAGLLFGLSRWALGAPLLSVLLGAVALGAFFGAQSWLSRGRWLGAGDPLLAAAIGAALAWPNAAAAVYVTYLAVIPLVFFRWLRTRRIRRVRWPFAPLLAIGGFVAWGWGEGIWRWLAG